MQSMGFIPPLSWLQQTESPDISHSAIFRHPALKSIRTNSLHTMGDIEGDVGEISHELGLKVKYYLPPFQEIHRCGLLLRHPVKSGMSITSVIPLIRVIIGGME